MDGNRRWAKKHTLKQVDGYEKGSEVIEEICRFCIDYEIKELTLYAFSMENWNRPKKEIAVLLNLMDRFLDEKVYIFKKHSIKFHPIGDLDRFKDCTKDKILNLANLTKSNQNLTLNLALSYSSKDEISRVCQKLSRLGIELNEQNIEANLEVPPVDLLVRTAGDFRISNFLLWQCSYAELFFSKTLWPEFNYDEMKQIVENFQNRKRTFGR